MADKPHCMRAAPASCEVLGADQSTATKLRARRVWAIDTPARHIRPESILPAARATVTCTPVLMATERAGWLCLRLLCAERDIIMYKHETMLAASRCYIVKRTSSARRSRRVLSRGALASVGLNLDACPACRTM